MTTRTVRTVLVAASVVVWLGPAAAVARAQSATGDASILPSEPRIGGRPGTTVAPSASVVVVHDDNLFWQPDGQSDRIIRVTPVISLTQQTAHSSWLGAYSFDAERYEDHPSLNTPFARQSGSLIGRVRTGPQTAFEVQGGYDRTLNAADLNLTTGLGAGRLLATRFSAGPTLSHLITSQLTLDASYALTSDTLADIDTIVTHAGVIRLRGRDDARNALSLEYRVERFGFDARPSFYSQTVLFGWTGRITPYTSLAVLAGPRMGQGAFRPEVDVTLARKVGLNRVALEYARTETTALGVVGLVAVQRVDATVGYHRPDAVDLNVRGGGYHNAVGGSTAWVYRGEADVSLELAGPLWLTGGYSIDYQRGQIVTLAQPLILPLATGPFGTAPLREGPFQRHVIFIGLTLTPTVHPFATPASRPPPPGGSTPPRS